MELTFTKFTSVTIDSSEYTSFAALQKMFEEAEKNGESQITLDYGSSITDDADLQRTINLSKEEE